MLFQSYTHYIIPTILPPYLLTLTISHHFGCSPTWLLWYLSSKDVHSLFYPLLMLQRPVHVRNNQADYSVKAWWLCVADSADLLHRHHQWVNTSTAAVPRSCLSTAFWQLVQPCWALPHTVLFCTTWSDSSTGKWPKWERHTIETEDTFKWSTAGNRVSTASCVSGCLSFRWSVECGRV